jgi:hypothetical protein
MTKERAVAVLVALNGKIAAKIIAMCDQHGIRRPGSGKFKFDACYDKYDGMTLEQLQGIIDAARTDPMGACGYRLPDSVKARLKVRAA